MMLTWADMARGYALLEQLLTKSVKVSAKIGERYGGTAQHSLLCVFALIDAQYLVRSEPSSGTVPSTVRAGSLWEGPVKYIFWYGTVDEIIAVARFCP